MKYEIDLIIHETYIDSEIAMLTGLELEDIQPLTSKLTSIRGKTYIEIFRKLGYSCNPRFIKFDKNSEYPCLMRTRKLKDKKYWYGFIYYDGKVYDHNYAEVLTWAKWNANYPNYRVTSMLQVWI